MKGLVSAGGKLPDYAANSQGLPMGVETPVFVLAGRWSRPHPPGLAVQGRLTRHSLALGHRHPMKWFWNVTVLSFLQALI